MIKCAKQQDLSVVESIMRRIREEDPSYWPHGLKADQFNGGVYLVKKSSTSDPVGFVAWQNFDEGGRRVGYYSIGILPEHRGQGLAKEAVSKVIRGVGAECDEVKAYVMEHNKPSLALAESLGVPVIHTPATTRGEVVKLAMEKSASKSKELGNLGKTLFGLGSGAGVASLIDLAVNKDKGAVGAYVLKNPEADKWTAPDWLLNFGAGMAAPFLSAYGVKLPGKIALTSAAAAKTLLAPIPRRMAERNTETRRIADALKVVSEKAPEETPSGKNWVESIPTSAWAGAGGLGLGALGLLALNAKKQRELKEREIENAQKGRVKITLPTKQPGDTETQVDIPFDDLNLSKALRGRLSRDTKRRLHSETKQRTRHRRPKDPKKPTEAEQELQDLKKERDELDKAAALVELVDELFPPLRKAAIGPTPAPQQAVPTPPQIGQNPALQMQQQAATANSMPPSQTAANPSIMQAEQKAMQAEQAAAEQAAQQQAQAQQAQMDQQAQFQQAMMKAEQEKEILKLELEKQKALSELNEATAKAQEKATSEAGKGEGDATQRLVNNRISRLQKRVTKAAGTAQAPFDPGAVAGVEVYGPGNEPAAVDPTTGKSMIHLRPQASGTYNEHAVQYGRLARTPMARVEYLGPIGSSITGALSRSMLYRPTTKPSRPTSLNTSILDPDKTRALTQALGANPMI